MNDEVRPGFYKDSEGVWRVDRRTSSDRRRRQEIPFKSLKDRRRRFRRKTDRVIEQREEQRAIDEALEDLEG
jgi:hypothetical protein